MSIQNLLEQLLKSGASAVGVNPERVTPFGTGAVAGGALALLLGTGRGRRLGGSALKVGSVAALGMLAYRAYTDWQAKQAPAATAPPPVQTVDRLPAPQAEQHSRALLAAMIAAAKSDGHLDDRERGLVEAELGRLAADPALRAWVEDQLRAPLDAAAVAATAVTPEMAAEVYLASVLVVDETAPAERAYLDQLALQLKLPAGLQQELEAKAAAG